MLGCVLQVTAGSEGRFKADEKGNIRCAFIMGFPWGGGGGHYQILKGTV